ncbi:MAG: Rrf2 family transcriptional regulator [Anaerolineae bacterium]|nr:Rrf2 family transcriptional regulator [Anaerolineae bacterium]
MRFSSKELYGLKAVVEIARHYPKGFVPLAWIARVRKLPLPYLEQIVPLLRKAGLVESIRGAKGGYRLAKPPDEISVGDVFRALEGAGFSIPCPVAGTSCILIKGVCCCPHEEECSTRELWSKTQALLFSLLDKVTIAELIKKIPASCPKEGGMRCEE